MGNSLDLETSVLIPSHVTTLAKPLNLLEYNFTLQNTKIKYFLYRIVTFR